MRTKDVKRKLFYLTVSLLPTPLRHAFYRRKFARVPTRVPAGLTFEMARSREDLEAAFRLLHDAYVAQGFIQPQACGLRLTIEHALPSTSVLIAKLNARVIGTISVTRDTPLGLPIEKIFNIAVLKRHGKRVAELSSLAIHPDFRQKRGGDIFFPLTLYAAMFARRCLGTDHLIFNLYPHHADFYRAIFGARKIHQEIKNSLGAPAAAVHVNLDRTFLFAKKKYLGLPAGRDLFTYTYVTEQSYFRYPPADHGAVTQPVLTPETFRYFFAEKTQTLQSLTRLEEQVVARYYPLSEYAAILPRREERAHQPRQSPRWDTRLKAELGPDLDAAILDISTHGCRVHVDPAAQKLLSEKQTDVIRVVVPFISGASATARLQLVWQHEDGVCGFQIVEADAAWHHLVKLHATKLDQFVG